MRLRYLHLPRCGPLTNSSVVFGREELVSRALNLPRQGALNFVVGVNGTGKSSLLRAIYRTFRALHLRERLDLPVAIAWDYTIGPETRTALFQYTGGKDSLTFAATCAMLPGIITRDDWQSITTALANGEPHALVQSLSLTTGPDALNDTRLYASLPKRLLAYTSGDFDPWAQMDRRAFQPVEEEADQYREEDEKLPGWSIAQEWSIELPRQMEAVLKQFAPKFGDSEDKIPGVWDSREFGVTEAVSFLPHFGPINELRKKRRANASIRNEQADESFLRITPRDLRYAGLTLAVWQCARELSGQHSDQDRAALRQKLREQRHAAEKGNDARRLLDEIDWFWPTHLSVTYRDSDDRVSARQHHELLSLVALAEDVIQQPLGLARAIVPLGPLENFSLTERLKAAFPFGIGSKPVEDIAKRVDKSKTGAEAILRLFSGDDELDSTPMDVFSRLRDWERTGLLEHVTLTVKRLHQVEGPDGDPDDVIVTWDQLSDGEQMLLGRIGLLFLLRGQDGSLLLLDEPETHFNDVWKREIVDMVDAALLNTTRASVIVATHTSIALTDAFAAEVTVLDKQDGKTQARSVKGGLFGTDPGEVNMNLFRADSSIGSRSVEILDQLLKTEWKGREKDLEEILGVLGSSFHRAELRAILKQLRGNSDGIAPP